MESDSLNNSRWGKMQNARDDNEKKGDVKEKDLPYKRWHADGKRIFRLGFAHMGNLDVINSHFSSITAFSFCQ